MPLLNTYPEAPHLTPLSPNFLPKQTTFNFKGFDEVRRLGLRPETEAAVRAAPARSHGAPGAAANAAAAAADAAAPAPAPAPKQERGTPPPAPAAAHGVAEEEAHSTGMLVVEAVVPGSPADGVLEPGDVLVKLNGQVGANLSGLLRVTLIIYKCNVVSRGETSPIVSSTQPQRAPHVARRPGGGPLFGRLRRRWTRLRTAALPHCLYPAVPIHPKRAPSASLSDPPHPRSPRWWRTFCRWRRRWTRRWAAAWRCRWSAAGRP